VGDPYLKLEVCKINEIASRKFQLATNPIKQLNSHQGSNRIGLRRACDSQGGGNSPKGHLPRVGSNTSMGTSPLMPKTTNSRKAMAAQQIFQDFKPKYKGNASSGI